MPQRARRATNKVDYSQFADPNASGDDSGSDADVIMDELVENIESADDDDDDDDDDNDDAMDVDNEEAKGYNTATAIEELENDIASEITPAKRKSSSRVAKPKKTAELSKDSGRKEVIKAKDITSVKDKFHRYFGYNNQKLVGLVNLRNEWERNVVFFTKDQLMSESKLSNIEIPDSQFTSLSSTQFDEAFPLESVSLEFQFNENQAIQLDYQVATLNDRTIVLNTNALITDIAWSNISSSSSQTLAVAISNIRDPTSEKFKLLERNSFKSVIQLYQFNPETKILKLSKSLLHNWGNASSLKFAPIASESGVISAVFNDGNLRVIKLDDINMSEFSEIIRPSFEFSLDDHIISTYDWLENGKIICGTDTGHITEFSIADNDPTTPSYLYPLHTSFIYSISAAITPYDETTALSVCADGVSTVFSTTDIASTSNKVTRSKLISKASAYVPHLYTFLQSEGPYTTKAIPIRAVFGTMPVSKHDGSTESLATSPLHPFAASGGSDGKVKIVNMVRRILCAPKQGTPSHKIMTLFELQYGETEGRYRLITSGEVEKLAAADNASAVNIYPHNVSITALSWAQSRLAGTWLAAGATGGLLMLHEV